MGDSAGGNLAAAMAQRRRDRGDYPRILGQVAYLQKNMKRQAI